MTEWKEYKLGDIAEITSSKRIFYSEYVENGVPFYRSKEIIDLFNRRDIQTELFITEKRFKEIEEKFGVPMEDDILLTSVGSLGVPYKVKPKDKFYFKDGNLTWFRNLDKSKVIPDFLFTWISSNVGKQKLDEVSIGSTQAALTISGLKTIEILLPNLETQKSIASILSSLDDKIDLLHRQNATLEKMAETLFRQWFVEEAKEEWKVGKISDLIDFNPSRKLIKGTKAPFLEMSELSTTTHSPSGWYSREFSSGSKFKNGDTLLARITPCLENGKAAYVDFLEDEQIAWGSTEFIVMCPKNHIHTFFAYAIARNQDFKDFAENCMQGSSGRQRVDIENLKSYVIALPSEDVITNFNNFCVSIVPKLKVNQTQIRTLTALRDTLLPKLMSGDVKVEMN